MKPEAQPQGLPHAEVCIDGAREERKKIDNARYQSLNRATKRPNQTHLGEIRPRVVGFLFYFMNLIM